MEEIEALLYGHTHHKSICSTENMVWLAMIYDSIENPTQRYTSLNNLSNASTDRPTH